MNGLPRPFTRAEDFPFYAEHGYVRCPCDNIFDPRDSGFWNRCPECLEVADGDDDE